MPHCTSTSGPLPCYRGQRSSAAAPAAGAAARRRHRQQRQRQDAGRRLAHGGAAPPGGRPAASGAGEQDSRRRNTSRRHSSVWCTWRRTKSATASSGSSCAERQLLRPLYVYYVPRWMQSYFCVSRWHRRAKTPLQPPPPHRPAATRRPHCLHGELPAARLIAARAEALGGAPQQGALTQVCWHPSLALQSHDIDGAPRWSGASKLAASARALTLQLPHHRII